MTNHEILNQSAESPAEPNFAEHANSIVNQNVVNNLECGEVFPFAVNLTVEHPVAITNLPVFEDRPRPKTKIISPSKIIPIPKAQSSKSPSKLKRNSNWITI